MLFPVKGEEATAFFNLVNTLHEKTSIIITTNTAPTEWVKTLNDEVLTSALTNPGTLHCTLQTSHLTLPRKLPKELSRGSSTDTEAESRST